jgi:hypothetical protein
VARLDQLRSATEALELDFNGNVAEWLAE